MFDGDAARFRESSHASFCNIQAASRFRYAEYLAVVRHILSQ
jgi:hypothetical protein